MRIKENKENEGAIEKMSKNIDMEFDASRRIYSNRLYVLETTPGLSGFKRYDEKEHHVVSGQMARLNRYDVIGEYTPSLEDTFRIENGRLPEYQPTADGLKVVEIIKTNPFTKAASTSLLK